jgi:hypothetical protein
MPLGLPPCVARMAFGVVGAAMACAAFADEGANRTRVPMSPKYLQECAACHVAYAPGLLPAASWQRLIDNLPRHFGTDASLDATTARELSSGLVAQAATGKRAREAPPQDRITLSAWFTREHDELTSATWKLPAVKSASNCAACHTQAEQGDFSERNVRIPR